jgi:capsid protein
LVTPVTVDATVERCSRAVFVAWLTGALTAGAPQLPTHAGERTL